MITTDIDTVYQKFESLSEQNMKSCLKKGLRKALVAVKQDAVKNLNAVIKNARKRNPKYNDTLQSGIRITKVGVTKKGRVMGRITIFSNGKPGSGSFRLAFLEQGSFRKGERYQKLNKTTLTVFKKPRYIGVLPGRYFFKKTMDTMSGYFQTTMNDAINEAVEKTNK